MDQALIWRVAEQRGAEAAGQGSQLQVKSLGLIFD